MGGYRNTPLTNICRTNVSNVIYVDTENEWVQKNTPSTKDCRTKGNNVVYHDKRVAG